MNRLDRALVAARLAPSRARAQALITAGVVRINGAVVTRASADVPEGAAIALDRNPNPWVSRGALKLAAALDHFGLDPAGRVALDLGASTGGFSEVLLARGAAAVWAVDVGHGQMAPSVAADPRLHAIDGLNVRDLTAAHVPPPGFVVADLAFIALAKALPPTLALAQPEAVLVALVKPQFELGPGAVGKGGLVRDTAGVTRAVAGVRAFLVAAGWRVLGDMPSPIFGGDGNAEALIAARKPGVLDRAAPSS